MASPLACRLVSTGKQVNRAQPGDTITFQFVSPPNAATGLQIDIQQAEFVEGGELTPGHVLARFKGSIQGGSYVPNSATVLGQGKLKHVPITLSDGTNQLTVNLIDTGSAVIRNELQVTVLGRVAGATESFDGRAAMFVDYPLAMIVPTKTAKLDASLNFVADWSARQWQPHDPTLRHVHSVPTVRSPQRALNTTDYDPLIAAFSQAVPEAPGGIIALAIGHGDGGEGNQTNAAAWCDLMPEDEKLIHLPDGTTVVPHSLFIDDSALADGSTKGTFPGGGNLFKLDALDRIADELKKAAIPIRKLLLHTCKAGLSKVFIQRFADRVGVPVQAHTLGIEYEGFLNRGHINAHYEGKALRASGEFDWPLEAVADESVPGPAPKRFPTS
jgi:hypothetical protein